MRSAIEKTLTPEQLEALEAEQRTKELAGYTKKTIKARFEDENLSDEERALILLRITQLMYVELKGVDPIAENSELQEELVSTPLLEALSLRFDSLHELAIILKALLGTEPFTKKRQPKAETNSESGQRPNF